jgi:1-acyl-sn-glycerol-3-phosphate acyltransferase
VKRVKLPARSFPWAAPTMPRHVERLADEKRSGSDYDTRWARRTPARYARFFVVEGPMRAFVKGVADPIRIGTDRLADVDGPLIFAGNHHSHLDAPLLLTSIPEPWRHKTVVAAAADYFFTNKVTSAASALALGAVPIERTKVSRRTSDHAAELLTDGWSLIIFPEGGRSPDGWGQGHRGGAAYLAAKTGVPVVPVHIQGTNRIFAKGDKRMKPGTTKVTFGAPMVPLDTDNSIRFAARIEAAVAALADEARSDWWSARRRAAAGATPALTGPEVRSWRRAWALGDRRGRARRRSPRWPEL